VVSLIHSIDSLKLLAEVSRQALLHDRVIDCLLQIHIAREETKFGLSYAECDELLAGAAWREMRGARICGLMGMASNTDDEQRIVEEFTGLRRYFEHLRATVFVGCEHFSELSMGMSDDYRLAVKAGSTLVRIGSHIFGERHY
jgi:pyridoxal phosphate enzyme (YggS family)